MEKEEILELLKPFCDQDDRARFYKPFNTDKYTYATNGVAAVRCFGEFADQDGGSIHSFSPRKMLENFQVCKEINEFQAIPKINLPFDVDNCTCLECEGKGYLIFKSKYNDYRELCQTCNGEEKVKPLKLNDTFQRPHTQIPSTGIIVNSIYLYYISKLPGARVQAHVPRIHQEAPLPVCFKWDLGDALLMPISGALHDID